MDRPLPGKRADGARMVSFGSHADTCWRPKPDVPLFSTAFRTLLSGLDVMVKNIDNDIRQVAVDTYALAFRVNLSE